MSRRKVTARDRPRDPRAKAGAIGAFVAALVVLAAAVYLIAVPMFTRAMTQDLPK